MSSLHSIAPLTYRALRATTVDGDYLASLQRRRLSTLVRHARRSSPWFRAWMRGLPDDVTSVERITPTRKTDLMDSFDDWVTDPRVTLERVTREFLSRPDLVGQKYLGRYRIFTTSGTTGQPAVVLHDPSSWLVLQLISRLRSGRQLWRHGLITGLRSQGLRGAAVFVTGGHYGGAGLAAAVQAVHPAVARRLCVISALDPIRRQVDELNRFQPSVISGYPSALVALAQEQQAGRLHIAPVILMCAGEHLSSAHRDLLEQSFGGHVLQGYAASEAPALSLECDEHRFHVNSDWYLLEPVDREWNPVPAGTLSDTCLVTNLSNYVQPVIRYDLGDRILLHPDRCPCGSRLPSVTVEGRTNDVLQMRSATGGQVTLLPLALVSVIEEVPGVERCQIVHPDPSTLEVRLDCSPGRPRDRVEQQVQDEMRRFLDQQGAGGCRLSISADRPQPEPSGKLKQVVGQGPGRAR